MRMTRTGCRWILLSTLALALPWGSARAAPGPAEKGVPAPAAARLTWRDLAGGQHSSHPAAGTRATVLVFGSTSCPCADEYTARLLSLARDYGPAKVRFFLVFSNPAESEAAIRAYAARR